MSRTAPPRPVEILEYDGLTEFPEPVRLASGNYSRCFIDGRQAPASAPDLRLASEVICERIHEEGIEFDAVGGITLGADALTIALALASGSDWFI